MEYDPSQFTGAARYYLQGRPPYSAQLGDVLAEELGLDGTGRLLDVGSGPGTLGVQLAVLFERVTLLEPDPDMLDEARAHARAAGLTAVDFVQATAEELPNLRMPPMRAVPFGQSFHRTDRVRVAEAVYEVLQPGGAMVLVVHDPTRSAPPQPPETPPIPHDDIDRLIRSHSVPNCAPVPDQSPPTRPNDSRTRSLEPASEGRELPTRPAEPTSSVTSTASSPAICPCPSPRQTCSDRGSTASLPSCAPS